MAVPSAGFGAPVVPMPLSGASSGFLLPRCACADILCFRFLPTVTLTKMCGKFILSTDKLMTIKCGMRMTPEFSASSCVHSSHQLQYNASC